MVKDILQPTDCRLPRLERPRNDPTKSIPFGNGTPIDPVHIEKTSKLAEKSTLIWIGNLVALYN